MKIVSTTKAPGAIGPYSQAVITGNLIYTSGQIPLVPETGEFVSGGIKEQTKQVCENISALLTASGSGIEKVVKTTCFLTDMDNFADFNEVYAKFFVGNPARSTVAVRGLPKNALVEVELIAELQ